MNNTAIIIKKLYSHGNKVALIDQKRGRIDGIIRNKPIIEGSVIQCAYSSMMVHDIEYIYVPLEWGKQNLLFLHHILEICYFFIPIHSCAEGIFDFLCFIFRMEELLWTNITQKIFLCKLFLLLGMYPQTSFLKTNFAIQLLHISLEDMLQLKIDKHEQKMVDQWLNQCIVHNHMSIDFKTIIFLQKAGK